MKTQSLSLVFALCLANSAGAQLMNFNNAQLTSGNAMQTGASYRFENVTSGIDAVINIDGLTNINLRSIDTPSINPTENSGWNPVFEGTGNNVPHYADFTVIFYANATNTNLSPDSLTTSVFGNDLSDISNGLTMEFVHLTGYSSMIRSNTLPPEESPTQAPWLGAWDIDNMPGYSIRLGWQGDNGPADGRGYHILMHDNSETNQFNTNSNLASLTSPVPEPSSLLLFGLSIFPTLLRRKR